jgi:hypothetical protein
METGIAIFCLHERAAEEFGGIWIIVLISKNCVLTRQEMKTGVLKVS